jgi:hypothetical protein
LTFVERREDWRERKRKRERERYRKMYKI